MEYNKVRGIVSAKEIWDTLKMSHEGNDEVKEKKMDLLQVELEAFVMKKDETVQQMHDRLTLLVTDIKTLGSKDWDDFKVTKKMLRAYAPNNSVLATIIRGKNSYKKMKPINLLNTLQFHEMNALDVAKSIAKEEVKIIALKAEPSKTVETNEKQTKQKKKVESSDGESTDEELALMVKNFKKFMKKRNVKKGTSQRRCYKCGEKDHFLADCPKNNNNEDEDKKYKDKGKDKSYDKEKRYKEKSKEYKKRNDKAHVGEGCESSDDSDNEGTASLALFTTSSTPRLFNNLSDDEDDHSMCLMAKGNKLEEAIKGKDEQIHELNMLVGKGNLKPKSDFKSHPAYDTARRFPSIGDGLGLTRGNKVNGTKIVNGQAIPLWKKGANLKNLMTIAHNGLKLNIDQGKNKVEVTTKVNTSNKKVPYPISRNYTFDYTVVIQNGKMVVKYIGAHTRRLRSVWAYSSGGSAWLIDSGCSNHMTREKDLFTSLETDDILKETIVFGDNSKGEDKSEVQGIVKKFIRRAHNEFELKIKNIRSDNGSKFRNTKVEIFFDEEGIKHEFSAPYTPQ
ncbi:uncharacterized protein LOC120695316 [Panicum virgatum]|uniref:uncharacterized protein LOC120695316 n=1 Tax=Panicum virgatum TaxID=38727 RepID=UPI0019D5E01C|nr:uncharacterized protein LOC120695316 [Panicum virgatum]